MTDVVDRTANIRVWDLPLRLFHWLLVATIAVAFLSSEEGSPLAQWHIASGWFAAVLVIFRLFWGFAGGEHARFVDFVRPSAIGEHIRGLAGRSAAPPLGHNPLGGLAVLLLLAGVAVVVYTGVTIGKGGDELHETIAWALLALVALHVAAVVIMSIIEKENLIRAMVTGRKPAARHPGASDARRPGTLALLLAALVVVGSVVAILRYDPLAFSPRAHAEHEHEGAAAVGGESADED
ncbi:MAG: cytochrome b/b6 domain-containing protein [Sphingomonadales bacterium]